LNKPEIDIVHEAIKTLGDSFWNETPDEGMVSNAHLFDDILAYINAAGYDLQLIKVE
jgi:hypothetical protein